MFGGILWLIGVVCAVWVIYDIAAFQKIMKDTNYIYSCLSNISCGNTYN